MRITFIRHGMTFGNSKNRYMGRTDEPLFERGIVYIKSQQYPVADIIISSPMKRCIETAGLIYPDKKPIIEPDFRECDFGDFEGKNYSELNGNSNYQKWIDSGGEMPFPNGESPSDFRKRSCSAFLKITEKIPQKLNVAMIVHGGTIMSIMSYYSVPKRSYFDFQIKNGDGFYVEWDGEKITVLSELK